MARALPAILALLLAAPVRAPVRAEEDDCGPRVPVDLPPDPLYHTDLEIAAELLALQNGYPAIARRVDLQSAYGAPFTHEGRPIYALKISGNVALDEDEPSVLIVSNHHARELITPEIALDLATRLLQGYGIDPAITARVDGWEIWISPTFNPDGLAYVWSTDPMWRKNRRNNGGGVFGVDLNRNYPVHWNVCGGSTNPSNETYQGPFAASEPETQAMMAFAARERFAKVLDFHSYSRDVRGPYGCNLCLPPTLCTHAFAVRDRLAQLAGYASALSCCGGGQFGYQVNRNGSLGFLLETGTAFQPPYSGALAEVARLRPAIDWFLDLPTPLSGHVRNRLTGEPVEADLEIANIAYQYAEVRRSDAATGRYHYILPAGNFDVTFRARGYVASPRAVAVSGSGTVEEVFLDPSARLTLRGTGRIGTTLYLDLVSPGDAGALYLAGAALATTPAQMVLGRVFPLAPDAVFYASLTIPAIFADFVGTLDASARATASVSIPAVPELAGLTVWFAFLTGSAAPAVHSVSAPAAVTLAP